MTAVTLTITGGAALERRLLAMGKAPKVMLGNIGIRAVREAKLIVPRKTGNLGRTIRVGTHTERFVEVTAGGSQAPGYAAAVEFGTRPHVIVPKTASIRFAGPFLRGQKGQRRGGVLAWGGPRTLGGRLRSGGKPTHFARRVRHPGTRGKPYLRPGLAKALDQLGLSDIVDAWNSGA